MTQTILIADDEPNIQISLEFLKNVRKDIMVPYRQYHIYAHVP